MSILRIRYANQLAVSDFDLTDQVNLMKGEAAILKAILGTTTQLDGLACTPNSPADLNVIVGAGTIIILEDVLDTALGQLPTQIPADTTHQIVKYAYNLDPTTIAITPPTTPGFSRNDLIQIGFSEADGNPQSIPFFNGFSGQTINPPVFQTLNSQRIDSVVIQLKQGVPAATGSQVTPSPDVGYIGAWVVTTAEGQTTITSGDITEYPNAPFLTEKLKDKISQAFADARYAQKTVIQAGSLTYAVAAGTANTYTASLSPNLTAYTTGMIIKVLINVANTGASTINIDTLGAKNIKLANGLNVVAGHLPANYMAELYYNGTDFILLNPAPVAYNTQMDATGTIAVGDNKFTNFGAPTADPYGMWNSTDTRFEAILAGRYRLNLHARTSGAAGGYSSIATLYVNGAQGHRFHEFTVSAIDWTTFGSLTVTNVAVNDYFELWLRADTNSYNIDIQMTCEYLGV